MEKSEIEEIVQARLKDAEVLLEASRFDGSVYLCCYAIELGLKARICRTLQLNEYPTSGKYKTFKTHDLDMLLHLTGLEDEVKLKYMTEWYVVGDALHLATASYHKIDYLLTWNCSHLANANKKKHIRRINGRLRLSTPEIITPLEIMEE